MFDSIRSKWLDVKTFVIALWSLRYKFLALVLVVAALIALNAYNTWTYSWSLRFQNPIQNFIIIEPVPQSQFQVNLAPRFEIVALSEKLFPVAKAAEVKPVEMTTEQYIRYVFGKEGNVAVAVFRAESGLRCDAQNINKGTNSLDLGVTQINSLHLRKGWKVAELLDCHRNIDLGYEIFKGSGWGAWSAYKNGSYKQFLNK